MKQTNMKTPDYIYAVSQFAFVWNRVHMENGQVPLQRLFGIEVTTDILRILHPIGIKVRYMANESRTAIERNRIGTLLGNDNRSYGYIVRDLSTNMIHYPRYIAPCLDNQVQVNEISTGDELSRVASSPFDFHALLKLPESDDKAAWLEAARQDFVDYATSITHGK